MADIVAVRHVAFEDLGVFEAAFGARGHTVHYVSAWSVDWQSLLAADPALLVVLGGPIGVYDEDFYPFLHTEIGAVRARLSAKRPILGLCLGAQIMASALGSSVYPAGATEIGLAPIRLTEEGRASVLSPYEAAPMAFHWHGDTFDLPAEARLLASSEAVTNQAFAIGDHALAFQFHPEVDTALVEPWLVGHAVELSHAEIDVAALRREALTHADQMRAKARAVAERIAAQFDL